ncbi:MAG: hypothetical protein ABI321_01045 [Polyangia bacterium]
MRLLSISLLVCCTATSTMAEPAPLIDTKVSCDLAERAIDGALRCRPDAKPTLTEQREMVKNARLKDRAYRPDTLEPLEECAWIALESARVSKAHPCPAVLTAVELAHLHAVLDSYGARRTTPKPTGDAGIDHALKGMTAARDQVCACKDASCAHAAEKAYAKHAEKLPSNSKPATTNDAASVLTEMGRCGRRLDFAAERP